MYKADNEETLAQGNGQKAVFAEEHSFL